MEKILNLGDKSNVLGETVDLIGAKTDLGTPAKVAKIKSTDEIAYPAPLKKIEYPGHGIK